MFWDHKNFELGAHTREPWNPLCIVFGSGALARPANDTPHVLARCALALARSSSSELDVLMLAVDAVSLVSSCRLLPISPSDLLEVSSLRGSRTHIPGSGGEPKAMAPTRVRWGATM